MIDLRRAFTLANEFKEGDLAVGGTADVRDRQEARRLLAAATIGDIRRTTFVDDAVSEALARSRDTAFDDELDRLTVAAAAAILQGPGGAAWARRFHQALTSEAIAALAKVMSGDQLSAVARTIFNALPGDGLAIGAPAHLGSRIQPNSPGDDPEEILFSILDGLAFDCGDVIIGLNPASDDVDSIVELEQVLEEVVRRLGLPTRFCVLSDIVKQSAAAARTRVDVAFQSLAGTSSAIAGMIGMDIDGLADLTRGFDALYFETGQGSEVTNGAAEAIDMVTLEARTYGVARFLGGTARSGASTRTHARPWMIVNDVAGFIGPEVFRTEAQLERACLEDAMMAKLHGLTMGLDVCATFHMGIDPGALRRLTSRIVERAAPAYLMAVAGNADPMLGYLTTSFRQHPELRAATRRDVASPMRRWRERLGANDAILSTTWLYAAYAKAGGDSRTIPALENVARARLQELRDRGFDLATVRATEANARVDAIYANARVALYAEIDDAVVRDACPRSLRIRTTATDRDDYIAHPVAGERIQAADARAVAGIYTARRPQVQVVISDGLNANAVNRQLRALLPAIRRRLTASGTDVGDTDVVVKNGRVRAGYEVGGLVGADVVMHIIGERPGTGLDTLSAYLTYGRNAAGEWRWTRQLDHAATTAICGIHPRGRRPEAAAAEIADAMARIIEQKRSGVTLE